MSSIDTNYGMESLNIAITKRSTDAQGKLALSILEGATQTAKEIQSSSPALKAPVAIDANKGNIIDTTA